MMNLFEGRFLLEQRLWCIFLLCEMGSIVPWGKLHSENQSSCDPQCVYIFSHSFYKINFADHVCNLLVCLLKFGWCHPLPCWCEASPINCLLITVVAMEQQNQNGWTDFLCFVNILKRLFCICVSCGSVDYFLKMKLHLNIVNLCLASLEWW